MDNNKDIQSLRNIIRGRRSVFPAQYIDQEIDDQIINDILENANWAPSHKITQPWRFKVLKGKAKGRLADFMADWYKRNTASDKFLEKKYQKLLTNPRKAGAIILICMYRDPDERIPEWEELASVSAAVQNMWLTSHAHGIGSYWSSPMMINAMQGFLQLEEGEKCLGLFYMGHYEALPTTPKRAQVKDKVQWFND